MTDCKCCGESFLTKGVKKFCTRKCKELFRDGRAYRILKGNTCVLCGFVPEHLCQLDVDHIDGDHSNNSVDNLQTLCANCHRLKTYKQRWG